ncbi:MAG: conjugal transfer protein TraF [Sutterella sp.]|nr:conjugal transfer protein TraF [Sutterella sp.]
MKLTSSSVFQSLGVVLLGFTVALSAAGASTPYFEADVWADPARPFLFYGQGKVSETLLKKKEAPRKPLSIADLKSEVQARLEAAVMDPTDENIAAYLKMNALLFEKAGRFAERWRDVLIRYPEYDWTTGHPVVNSASTTLSRERDKARSAKLATLSETWGLVFFGDAGRLTGLMRPLVDRFAGMTGMELIQVAVGGPSPYLSRAYPDSGVSRRASGGIKKLPALVLMHKDDSDIAHARLVATGVVDIAELGRRVVRLVEAHERQTPFPPAHVKHPKDLGEIP